MREIEFRGKPIFDDQDFWNECADLIQEDGFVYGNLINIKGGPFIVGNVIEATEEYIHLEYWIPVDPETVGQYTGIKDKNGVKIFEGDICNYWTPEYYDNSSNNFFESKWETGVVTIETNGVNFGGWQYSTPFGGSVAMYELIGNIHENAEHDI